MKFKATNIQNQRVYGCLARIVKSERRITKQFFLIGSKYNKVANCSKRDQKKRLDEVYLAYYDAILDGIIHIMIASMIFFYFN
jgi:hypothetical protein